MSKIRVKSVTLHRLEGNRTTDIMEPITVPSIKEADDILKEWARTAPDYGYDKTSFKIEYEDGETYEGRYDLKSHDMIYADISRHVSHFCEFYSGQRRPDHLSVIEYKSMLRHCEDVLPGEMNKYTHFLDNYEIGE